MSESDYTDLAGIEDVPAKGFIVRKHGDLQVLLARINEGIFAVENLCSHAFARFDAGRLRGARLVCPLHGACFDIRSGAALGRPATGPIRTFRVRVDAGRILVALADATPDA